MAMNIYGFHDRKLGAEIPRAALNIAEAARALAVGQTKLRQMISDGSLGAVKVGRRVFIPVGSITEFLNPNSPRSAAARNKNINHDLLA